MVHDCKCIEKRKRRCLCVEIEPASLQGLKGEPSNKIDSRNRHLIRCSKYGATNHQISKEAKSFCHTIRFSSTSGTLQAQERSVPSDFEAPPLCVLALCWLFDGLLKHSLILHDMTSWGNLRNFYRCNFALTTYIFAVMSSFNNCIVQHQIACTLINYSTNDKIRSCCVAIAALDKKWNQTVFQLGGNDGATLYNRWLTFCVRFDVGKRKERESCDSDRNFPSAIIGLTSTLLRHELNM